MLQYLKKLKKIRIVLALGVTMYLFWGPLFPWNPIKIGYTKISFPKATVYVKNYTENDSIVYHLQDIIDMEETFHGLEYRDHFKVVILGKESNNKRYLPWMNGSGFSVSLSPMSLIYIGSKARKSDMESYIKHEMSHMLIDQNTTFQKAMTIHKQPWFVEGIAEYISDHGFYTKNDLVNMHNRGAVVWPKIEEKTPQSMSWQELQIKYSYYKYFIKYLVEQYGLEKLQTFVSMYVAEPIDYNELFDKIYEIDLDEAIKMYNISMSG